jgi:hypothetical protein
VSAKVHGGVVGFDGSLITIRNGWGWERRKVIPVTAVRMVQWVAESNWRSGQLRLHLHDQTLEWDAWQQAPPGSHDPLALASRDGERAILLAAAVAWTIGRAGGTTAPARTVSTAAPVVAGLAAEAPAARAVLEGVAGRAVLDSAAVTITARGVTRRIPLRAIDWIELVDVRYPPGEGYVRVHLEGAPSDLEVFDPWRDADTVVHTDDHAALEFAHQVTAAMDGLVPVAHPELIATRGDRPDLTRALGRASPRARTLTPALRILPLLLQPGEQIEVLEAADWKALLGLLVVTDRRVLMVAGEPVAELTWELPAAGTVSTWTPQDDRHHGALSLLTRSGTHPYVTGVWTPWRFTRVLSPAPHPGKAGHTP